MRFTMKFPWPRTAEDKINHFSKLTRFIRRLSSGKTIGMILFICLSSATSLLLYTLSYLFPSDSLFNISTSTQFVVVEPYQGSRYPDWELYSIQLHDGCTKDYQTISGQLTIDSASTIEFQRVQDGALQITLQNDNSSGRIIADLNKTMTLKDCAVISMVRITEPLVFPVEGSIAIGKTISEARRMTPLILEGKIHVGDKKLFSGSYYQSNPLQLNLGDQFNVKNPTTPSVGFIYIDSDSAMTVTYRVKGEEGIVKKYKSEPITVKNSLWVKLANDDNLSFAWLMVLAFIAFTRWLIDYSVAFDLHNNISKEKRQRSRRSFRLKKMPK